MLLIPTFRCTKLKRSLLCCLQATSYKTALRLYHSFWNLCFPIIIIQFFVNEAVSWKGYLLYVNIPEAKFYHVYFLYWANTKQNPLWDKSGPLLTLSWPHCLLTSCRSPCFLFNLTPCMMKVHIYAIFILLNLNQSASDCVSIVYQMQYEEATWKVSTNKAKQFNYSPIRMEWAEV